MLAKNIPPRKELFGNFPTAQNLVGVGAISCFMDTTPLLGVANICFTDRLHFTLLYLSYAYDDFY